MSSHDDTVRIRMAGAAQGFNWLPVLVADQQGILARHGIEVELLKLGSVDKATAAVREGSADVAITPPEGAIRDHLDGGTLTILGSNSERLPMSLVARPGINTLEDLRGRRIGTSSLTEGTAVYTQLMLNGVGLAYPDDYEFVISGVHTARWTALQNDEIDAAPQPAPWNFLAEREGFGLLGEVSDVLPEIIFAAVIADSPWVEANGEIVDRLIAALAEGHDRVNDSRFDDTTLPIYQAVTTPDDADLARRGLEYTRSLGMWPVGLRTSTAAFDTTIDVMASTGLMRELQRTAARGVLDARQGDGHVQGR